MYQLHMFIIMIEFQSHAKMKINCNDNDRIPDQNEDPELYEIVRSCMIHGPGRLNLYV